MRGRRGPRGRDGFSDEPSLQASSGTVAVVEIPDGGRLGFDVAVIGVRVPAGNQRAFRFQVMAQRNGGAITLNQADMLTSECGSPGASGWVVMAMQVGNTIEIQVDSGGAVVAWRCRVSTPLALA